MKQIIIRSLVLLAVFFAGSFLLATWRATDSAIMRALSVQQVNGGNAEFVAMNAYQAADGVAYASFYTFFTLLAISLLWRPVAREWSKGLSARKSAPVVAAALLALSFCSCAKYDVPEYVEIGNNETGFLFPLEGDTAAQAKFESVDFLKQKKVAGKRIQIHHRWNTTGRTYLNGDYIPMERVVVVDRSPVTREFNAENKALNNAVWVESKDSVGFSLGFNCTAYVTEEDAPTFLYWYPSKQAQGSSKFVTSLTPVMDSEIRARIQQIAAEVAAKYPLDALREKKQEIVDAVREDIVAFFTKRGITITTIGMFGGMTYENPKIQSSIDEVFVAQQQKNVAQAEWEAQGKKNDTITLAAQARKTALVTERQGEAEGILAVNKALEEAKQNPMFLQLKALEVQTKQIEKWNGTFPAYYMGAGAPAALLNIPAPK